MKKTLLGFAAGAIVGMAVAIQNEDELEDAYHKACRCKRKIMRKVHHLQHMD